MKEVMNYVKAIVHELIKRAFLEKWDSEAFLAHYENQMSWMKNGLNAEVK
jgi:hypothetical protein